MPSQVRSAGSGTGTSWSNPGNITSSDDAYASWGTSGVSTPLDATAFSFSIPSNATITNIAVSIEKRFAGDEFSGVLDDTVRLLKSDSPVGDNLASSEGWPTLDTYITYSGGLWGTTWTPTEVNDGGFGVRLAVNLSYKEWGGAFVDHIEIGVDYTVPGWGPLMSHTRNRLVMA